MNGENGRVYKFSDFVEQHGPQLPGTPPSLTLTFNDAAARAQEGLSPRQPHSDGHRLLAEAFIAQTFLRKLGTLIGQNFPGSVFNVGPPKDADRAIDKIGAKNKKLEEQKGAPLTEEERADLSDNCDFSRAMVGLRSLDQIRQAIEVFGSRGFAALEHNDQTMEFLICDTHDTFSYPDDEKKPGYRNLDVKIAVPLGNDSYHVCELQFIHEGTRAAYKQSHIDMETERLARKRAEMIEESLKITMNDLNKARLESSTAKIIALEDQEQALYQEYDDNTASYREARHNRAKTNIEAALSCGLDELRKDGKTIVAPPAPKGPMPSHAVFA
ncbi:MAG: hypothetical protein HYU57_00380 [Micavibrio aeruginosavorus]|nr:hypothetical protein [Micavibrio aeruginosavorus]